MEQRIRNEREGRGYKKLLGVFAVFALCFLFSGCTSGKLAEEFSEKTLENTSKDIINEALVQGAGETIKKHMREDFLQDFPVEELQDNLLSLQSGKGEFLYFKKISMRGEESPKEDSDEDFAVVLVTVSFEKGDILFYLTYDTEMHLVSFYVQ